MQGKMYLWNSYLRCPPLCLVASCSRAALRLCMFAFFSLLNPREVLTVECSGRETFACKGNKKDIQNPKKQFELPYNTYMCNFFSNSHKSNLDNDSRNSFQEIIILNKKNPKRMTKSTFYILPKSRIAASIHAFTQTWVTSTLK